MLTRWAVRGALLLYAATLALRMRRPIPARVERVLYTAGAVLFAAHVAAAFHYFHHWSHADAYAETARQTREWFGVDWGGGLYLNYLFTLLWVADAAWWWTRPADEYFARPRWVDVALQAFMLFMAFNGAIVFARPPARWVAVAVLVALGSAAAFRGRGLPRPGPGG